MKTILNKIFSYKTPHILLIVVFFLIPTLYLYHNRYGGHGIVGAFANGAIIVSLVFVPLLSILSYKYTFARIIITSTLLLLILLEASGILSTMMLA